MYLGLAPLGGGKVILLLDYIDAYVFTVLLAAYMMAMEAMPAVEVTRMNGFPSMLSWSSFI
jgi:hypothetical protein